MHVVAAVPHLAQSGKVDGVEGSSWDEGSDSATADSSLSSLPPTTLDDLARWSGTAPRRPYSPYRPAPVLSANPAALSLGATAAADPTPSPAPSSSSSRTASPASIHEWASVSDMAQHRAGPYDPPGVPHPLQLAAHRQSLPSIDLDLNHHLPHDHPAHEQQQQHDYDEHHRRMSMSALAQQHQQPHPGDEYGHHPQGRFDDSAQFAPGPGGGEYEGGGSQEHYGDEGDYASASHFAPHPAYAHASSSSLSSHPLYARSPAYAHPQYAQSAPPPPPGSAGSRPSSSYGAANSQSGYDQAHPPPMQHPAYASRSSSFSQPLPPMSLVPDGSHSASSFRYSPQTGPLPSIAQQQAQHPAYNQQQQHQRRPSYQQGAGDLYPADDSFAYAPPPVDHDAAPYHDGGYAHNTTFSHPAYARASSATQPAPPSLSINTSFARPSTSHAAPMSSTPASASTPHASPWSGPPPPSSLSLGALAQRRRSATDAMQQGYYSRRLSHEEEERRRASLGGALSRSLGPSSSGSSLGRRSVDYAASGLVGPASAGQSPEVHGDRQLGPPPIPLSAKHGGPQRHDFGVGGSAASASATRSPQLRFAPPPPAAPVASGSLSARECRASGDREGAVPRVVEEDEGEGEDELVDDELASPKSATGGRTSRAASAGSTSGAPSLARRATTAGSYAGAGAGAGSKRRRLSATMAGDFDEDDEFAEDDGGGSGKGRREPTSKKFTCPHPSCGRAFARNFNLMSHIKSHQGIREFKCPECNKLFSRKHDCTRHCIAIHHYDKDGQAPVGKQPVYVAQEILPVGVMVERAKERQRAASDAVGSSSSATGSSAPLLSGSRPLGARVPLLSTGAEPVLLHPPPLSATPSSASSTSTPSVPTPIDGRPPIPLHLPPPHHALQHPAYPPPPPPAQPRYAGDESASGAVGPASPQVGFAPPAPSAALRAVEGEAQ